MRARVNLALLTKIPVKSFNLHSKVSWSLGRNLHSDAGSSAAVSAAPAQAATASDKRPLADLLGRKHNYLRISLTERCNLRCQYCMPAEGVPLSARAELLSRGELLRLVRTFAALGVVKLRLTGGEPTLRPDLADIIQELNAVPGIKWVGMTTNGLVLTRRLVAYQRAGLAALNISLDSLKPERYEKMSRRPGLKKVLAGVDLALQLGYRPVKINVVLMKGFNDDEIVDFVEYTRSREVEVRFIEFMPFGGNKWDDSKLVPHRAAVRALVARYPDAAPCLPRPNDTARVWKVPGYLGCVGFISSMTNNFCSTCNRLRLTADGNLKVCLFGAAELSLRDALREGATDAQLEDLIRVALRNKKPQHAASPTRPPPPRAATAPFPAKTAAAAPSAFYSWKFNPGRIRPMAPSTVLSALSRPTRVTRAYCTGASDASDGGAFTHLDDQGRAQMVDVGGKAVTSRRAVAACNLRVGARLLRLLRDARLPKGDALQVARLAGVMAAKRTAELIPLCHPLPLDAVRVQVTLPPAGADGDGGDVAVRCEVAVTARTGAEMEALTGAAVAALALYDMCKAVDKGMRLTDLRLVRKSGGRSGDWPPAPAPPVRTRALDTSPLKPEDTYVPVVHF